MKTKILFKTISLLILAVVLDGCGNARFTTNSRDLKKASRQKTRQLEKDGYRAKGAATVEIYVEKALEKEFKTDEEGEPVNTVVYTSAVAPTFEGAVSASRAAARATLAGNIETRVGELVKRSLNNEQITARSADGINKTVTAGKQLIAQKVSMEDTYVLYREVKDERDGKTLIEVEYAGAFSNKLAMQQAREHVRETLKDETEELHKELDNIFELD